MDEAPPRKGRSSPPHPVFGSDEPRVRVGAGCELVRVDNPSEGYPFAPSCSLGKGRQDLRARWANCFAQRFSEARRNPTNQNTIRKSIL